MKFYECWISDGCITLCHSDAEVWLKEGALAYTIEAESWIEAMTIHHQKQGWEPYVPFDEDI